MIAVNRSRLIQTYYPTTTDPITGETVADPEATPRAETIYCRIAHERRQVPDDTMNPAGMSTNLGRMILTDYRNIPREDAIIGCKDCTIRVTTDDDTRVTTTDDIRVLQDAEPGLPWSTYTFQVGPVDPIWKHGGIVGYQAPLREAV